MQNLKLSPVDEGKVRQVLADVASSVQCEIGIAGSLAQRALSPDVALSLEGTSLHDVDLLLLGVDATKPALPKLRELFTVLEAIRGEGWYYGMWHKETGMWVDLFTPAPFQHLKPVMIDGISYRASSLESQIVYLARNIFWRKKDRRPIREKWLAKLTMLSQLPGISWKDIEDEYAADPEHFREVFPDRSMFPKDASVYVRFASKQKPTSWIGEKMHFLRRYLRRRKQ